MDNNYAYYLEKENDFNTGSDYTIHFDLLNYIGEWSENCTDEQIAMVQNNLDFLSKLKEIPVMLLKYIVTNQSLYV